MKSGFKDPIESSVKPKSKKSPWDFKQPSYDERSSCFVNAGTHYGVGFKQPVGHASNPKEKAATLPEDRRSVSTMKVKYVPLRNEPIEMED